MINSINPTNYLALDLEFNTIDLKITNIIQVGVAIGNINDGIIKTQSWFVNPNEPLSDHIISLTGITEDDIKNAPPLQEIANDLKTLIETYNTFVNPIQWGFDDDEELKSAFRNNGINFPYFGRRAIDVKQIFTFLESARGNTTKSNLKNSMNKYKLKFEGKPHRADVDAKNTLIFFFELMNRQRKLEEMITSIKNLKI
jgi:DNA polymerase III alpha subunit (gram-positive type)